MPADYSRIHRLLKIITLIQGSSDWTAGRLALECQTTQRTIYRDLKMLEGAGIPYFYDDQKKCYAIRRDFFLPPVQLTLEEALSLVSLAGEVGGGEQVPFMATATKAIEKVRGQLPQSIRDELDQIAPHVAIKLAAAGSADGLKDVYQLVRTALAGKRVLRCRYESLRHGAKGNGKAEADEFLFKPYALLFSQRAWYAVGYHGGRKEVRTLKLSRFSQIKATNDSYEIPKSFTLKKHLGNAWRMIKGDKDYKVELVFDAEFAETVEDTFWHPTQETESNGENGTMTFRCTVAGLDEIVWWVLSMGPHCVVKQPRELAAMVAGLAAGIVRHYQKQDGQDTAKAQRPARVPAGTPS